MGCNTLIFAPFEIELSNLIMYFCAHKNIGKIIFFIKLKFIIRLSNTVVHTCWCIRFDVMFDCFAPLCVESKQSF